MTIIQKGFQKYLCTGVWKVEVWGMKGGWATCLVEQENLPGEKQTTMEKSSHLRGREATMVLSGGGGCFTATLSYSYDDTLILLKTDHVIILTSASSSKNQKASSSTSIIMALSVHCPDKSPMNDIHWRVTIVHDSSQLNGCLTHHSKGGLPSQGSNHSNWARCALEVEAVKPQTFWEEKIFLSIFFPEGCPLLVTRLFSSDSALEDLLKTRSPVVLFIPEF